MLKELKPKRNICPKCGCKGKKTGEVDELFYFYKCPKCGHEWVTH